MPTRTACCASEQSPSGRRNTATVEPMLDGVYFETFSVGPLQTNMSILGDAKTKKAVLVDPGHFLRPVICLRQRAAHLTLPL